MDTIPEPSNVDAEKAMLGAVLISGEAMQEGAFLEADDFFLHNHRWLWSAFLELQKRNAAIDVVTVGDYMASKGYENWGGDAYLAELMDSVPTSTRAKQYAEIVEEYSTRRKMLRSAELIARKAYDLEQPASDGLSYVQTLIDGMGKSRIATRTLTEQVSSVWELVEQRMADPKDVWGIPTGLADLDRHLGGLEKFTILAGLPGKGKSILAGQIAHYAASQHAKHVRYYSGEMKAEQILMRMIHGASGVSVRKMKSGRITPSEFSDQFIPCAEALTRLPLVIVDSIGNMTMRQVKADMLEARRKGQLDLAIIDYLGKIGDPTETDDVKLSKKQSGELKNFVEVTDVTLVAINTMPKRTEHSDKIPDTHAGSGSSIVGHDCDNMLFLMDHLHGKDEPYDPRLVTIVVAKSRESGQGMFNLRWRDNCPGFDSTIRERIDAVLDMPVPYRED